MDPRESHVFAADYLDSRDQDAEATAAGRSLLSELGGLALENVEERRDLSRLLRVAAGLNRIFRLVSPDMPGLHFFGAEIDPDKFGAPWGLVRGSSGVGVTPLDAFRGCIGEAVEYLSQHICDGSRIDGSAEGLARLQGSAREHLLELADRAIPSTPGHDWQRARLLDGDAEISLPMDYCWRRAPQSRHFSPRYAPGLGCSAGRTGAAACRAALLEVVERDALALWWRGGRPAKPVFLETLAASGVMEILRRARQGRSDRRSWFLDITTDLGIPVVVSVSVKSDGRGFAFGLSAALTIEDALVPACLELGQLELADHLVAAKAEQRGEDGLNEFDRMHRTRTNTITAACPIVHPAASPDLAEFDREVERPLGTQNVNDELAELSDRLIRAGHEVILVDQTNGVFQVPVIRAIVPTLQPDPGDIETPRLRKIRRRFNDDGMALRPAII